MPLWQSSQYHRQIYQILIYHQLLTVSKMFGKPKQKYSENWILKLSKGMLQHKEEQNNYLNIFIKICHYLNGFTAATKRLTFINYLAISQTSRCMSRRQHKLLYKNIDCYFFISLGETVSLLITVSLANRRTSWNNRPRRRVT